MSQDENWQHLMDELARQAIGDGRADDLPGAGRPLSLDHNPYAPDDMRLAFKMMRDNDIAPDWIEAGKALRKAEAALEDALARFVKLSAGEQQRQMDGLRERVAAYNNDVLSYNLKVPPGVTHRRFLDLGREIDRRRNKNKPDRSDQV